MGDFVRHTFRTLHTIHAEDAEGTKLAVISISANIHRVESWAHLEAAPRDTDSLDGLDGPVVPVAPEPAGPHNRRIIDVVEGYTVYGHAWGVSADEDRPLSHGLDEVLAKLEQDEGAPRGEELVGFEDPAFREACAAWIAAETGTKAVFVESLR